MRERRPVRVVWMSKPCNQYPELPEGATWGYWSEERDSEITALVLTAWEGRYGQPYEVIKTLKQYDLIDKASPFIEVGGKIIGASLGLSKPEFDSRFGGIGMIVVDQPYQGGNIAKALILKSLDAFYKMRVSYVVGNIFVPNHPHLDRLFKALGCEAWASWWFRNRRELIMTR